MILNYNNIYMEESQAKISCTSKAFNFGEGFFTTIRVKEYKIEHLKYHLKRVEESLVFFNFKFKIPDFKGIILNLLEINNLNSARVKITIFKEYDTISFIIFCSKLPNNIDTHTLTTSNFVRGNNPLFNYKSLNYYSNLTGKDTLFIDFNGCILETGIANIFFMKDNLIYTPTSNLPLLNGVYRRFLLQKNYGNKYRVFEKDIKLKDISNYNSAFITNSIRGIEAVKRVDNIEFNTNPVLEFRDYVNE